MTLPTDKEIMELIEAGATTDAREKILQLRQAALILREENFDLRDQILALQDDVAQQKGTCGKRCPRCGKETWVLEPSEQAAKSGESGGATAAYKCTDCGFTASSLARLD